jgi:hypothetical protein
MLQKPLTHHCKLEGRIGVVKSECKFEARHTREVEGTVQAWRATNETAENPCIIDLRKDNCGQQGNLGPLAFHQLPRLDRQVRFPPNCPSTQLTFLIDHKVKG